MAPLAAELTQSTAEAAAASAAITAAFLAAAIAEGGGVIKQQKQRPSKAAQAAAAALPKSSRREGFPDGCGNIERKLKGRKGQKQGSLFIAKVAPLFLFRLL